VGGERDASWQAVEREPARLQRVVAGRQPAADPPSAVEDEHRADPRVIVAGIDPEQPGQARRQAGLLA